MRGRRFQNGCPWVLLALPLLAMLAPTAQAQRLPVAQRESPKEYLFEMRNVPWNKVIEWLCEHTETPFVGSCSSGMFTFIPPETESGPRKYTVPEIIDILNEELAKSNLILIRRTDSFTIWPLDVKLDGRLIPRVTSLEELKTKRGKSEIVSVIVPLKALNAIDVVPYMKKMLGPYGEIVPLETTNSLYLSDRVGNLLDVVRLIELSENASVPK